MLWNNRRLPAFDFLSVTDVLTDVARQPAPHSRAVGLKNELEMSITRHKDEYERPPAEPLAVRKRRAAVEASQAMSDYRRAQDAARDRLIAQREERLARETGQKEQ